MADVNMASSERPVFKPPKKRIAKKPGDSSVPVRVHCYDVITSLPAEDFNFKNRADVVVAAKGQNHDKATGDKQNEPTTRKKARLKTSPLKTIADEDQEDLGTDSQNELLEQSSAFGTDSSLETSALNQKAKPSHGGGSPSISFEVNDTDIEAVTEKSALNDEKLAQNNYITMTGTIKRGKKAGQTVDFHLNMSREELEDMEASIISHTPETKKKMWSGKSGIHVLLLTVLCAPLVLLISGGYSFYLGTLTWYNVYLYYSEERTIWHRICVCPFLILFYPFYIIICTVGLGFYAAGIQFSWNYDRWRAEVQDLEKGFYGWLCSSLGLDDCAPYEVVILNDLPPDAEGVPVKVHVADTAL